MNSIKFKNSSTIYFEDSDKKIVGHPEGHEHLEFINESGVITEEMWKKLKEYKSKGICKTVER